MAESIISLNINSNKNLIEPMSFGSQTFTSNGTFTAPYDGLYTIVLNAPVASNGEGGEGGVRGEPSWYFGGDASSSSIGSSGSPGYCEEDYEDGYTDNRLRNGIVPQKNAQAGSIIILWGNE